MDKAEQILNEMVIPLIKGRMAFKKYDQKIVNATRIENVTIDLQKGSLSYDVVSDYISRSGFDISTVREEKSTVRHFIKPTKKKALRFFIGGIKYFSKGHWVKGIEASFIIADTIKEMQPFVERRLEAEADLLFQKVVGVRL